MNKRIKWKKIKQRGNLLGRNVDCPSMQAGPLYEFNEDGTLSDKIIGYMPDTYFIKGFYYNSYSALKPVGNKRNPHEYIVYDYDEDEGCENGWGSVYIEDPLGWQTEKEFLERFEKERLND